MHKPARLVAAGQHDIAAAALQFQLLSRQTNGVNAKIARRTYIKLEAARLRKDPVPTVLQRRDASTSRVLDRQSPFPPTSIVPLAVLQHQTHHRSASTTSKPQATLRPSAVGSRKTPLKSSQTASSPRQPPPPPQPILVAVEPNIDKTDNVPIISLKDTKYTKPLPLYREINTSTSSSNAPTFSDLYNQFEPKPSLTTTSDTSPQSGNGSAQGVPPGADRSERPSYLELCITFTRRHWASMLILYFGIKLVVAIEERIGEAWNEYRWKGKKEGDGQSESSPALDPATGIDGDQSVSASTLENAEQAIQTTSVFATAESETSHDISPLSSSKDKLSIMQSDTTPTAQKMFSSLAGPSVTQSAGPVEQLQDVMKVSESTSTNDGQAGDVLNTQQQKQEGGKSWWKF